MRSQVETATRSILEDANGQSGTAWRLESRLAGGLLGGAWLVREGALHAVLKWHGPSSEVPRNPDAAAVVAYIRARGYPTPAWLSAGTTTSGDAYSIQEFVPGHALERLDVDAAELIVDLVRLQRTLSPPTDLDWSTFMRDHVFDDAVRRDELSKLGDVVGVAVADAVALAAPYESTVLEDHEMVHCDLSLSNILVDDGRLAGVVDIDAGGRGCAVYDVLAAALNGVVWDADPEAVARLHAYALESYGAGPVAVAAATLVFESIQWFSKSPRLEQNTSRCRQWLAALKALSS